MRPEQLREMYEGWVRDYAADLYRCALRLTGSADAAEELVQETFYEAWRSIHSLRDAAKARAWLFKILGHRYMHWVRERVRSRQNPAASEAEVREADSGESLPVDVLARQETLQAALDDLDEGQKVPFLLVFLEGMTCQQAADMLDMPLGTVLSRIHRVRQLLRARLAERPDAPPLKLHRPPQESEAETGKGRRETTRARRRAPPDVRGVLLPPEHPLRQAVVEHVASVDGPLEHEWLELVQEDERLRVELVRVKPPPPGLRQRLMEIPLQAQPTSPVGRSRWWTAGIIVAAALVLAVVVLLALVR